MLKVVAIMSMSLDGYVAERNAGVADVFDWYSAAGHVAFHTGGSDPMTFQVAEPSADHLRTVWSELGAVFTGRRTKIPALLHLRQQVYDAHAIYLKAWKAYTLTRQESEAHTCRTVGAQLDAALMALIAYLVPVQAVVDRNAELEPTLGIECIAGIGSSRDVG